MTPVEELFQLLWDTPKDKLTWFAIKKRMLEKEKEEMCDFVEYCIQRHREFMDGDLPSREYEGDIGEMFDWRYADKATKAKMTRERNKFWKEANEMRREREEKFKQELK